MRYLVLLAALLGGFPAGAQERTVRGALVVYDGVGGCHHRFIVQVGVQPHLVRLPLCAVCDSIAHSSVGDPIQLDQYIGGLCVARAYAHYGGHCRVECSDVVAVMAAIDEAARQAFNKASPDSPVDPETAEALRWVVISSKVRFDEWLKKQAAMADTPEKKRDLVAGMQQRELINVKGEPLVPLDTPLFIDAEGWPVPPDTEDAR